MSAATDRSFIKRKARSTLITAAAWLVVSVMIVVAAIFFLITAYLALEDVLPDWAAAFLVGTVALIIAGIASLVARRETAVPPPTKSPLAGTLVDRPDDALAVVMGPLIDEALKATRERPGETVMLAMAAGMLIGRLLRRPGK